MNESRHQILQVSQDMFFCAAFVSDMETWCTQHKLRTGSSFVTDDASPWQTVDRRSNSVFEPRLSIESFHFLSELHLCWNWINPSVGPCYLSYTIIFSRPFIATVGTLSTIYGQYPTKVRKHDGGGGVGDQAEKHPPFFQLLFNATLTALQMSAKYARMLLFSLSNINPHLSVWGNSGLPQPVYFAYHLTDRSGEWGASCACVACCRCHILDCCTRFFRRSRTLWMLLHTAALPTNPPCICQRQDKTHLIWTSNSLFAHSQPVESFRFICWGPRCYSNTHTSNHQNTAWDHSLQMWEPIKYKEINTIAVGIVAGPIYWPEKEKKKKTTTRAGEWCYR